MSYHRVYLDYIRDMLESAEKALQFVEGMNFEEFVADEKVVWRTVQEDLPTLGKQLKNILDDYSYFPK